MWVLWHVAWLFGFVWVLRAGWPTSVDMFFAVLYTVFLPVEVLGVVFNHAKRDEPETARTLSQFRQRVAQEGKSESRGVGWPALAGGSAAIDACVMTMLVSTLHPVIGMVVGFTVFLWLAPHFGWREDVG